MPSEACTEELESLSAIFLDEIDIHDETLEKGAQKISMVLYPATADDEESRYVTLTLELILPLDYPKCPPKILFRNPRGLNDMMLEHLMTTMKERCEDRLESQMIYELIDMCKEFLTKNNRPASECPICLFSFTEFDVFYRTRCFHHFHSQCLGSYLKNLSASFKEEDNVLKEKQELTCPVCRECLEDGIDIEKLVESPPPAEELELSHEHDASAATTSVLQDWEGRKEVLKKLFEKQKSQGGIIDLTETKKMLVISSPVSSSRDDNNESQGGGGGATSNNLGTSSLAASLVTSSSDSTPATKQQQQQHGTSEQSTGGRHQQKNKNHHHHPNNNNNTHHAAAGSHRRAPNQQQQQLCSSDNAASGGGSGGASKATKSVRGGEGDDPQVGGTRDKESDSRHPNNGRCRRGGGGGGYNNRDRRRNK